METTRTGKRPRVTELGVSVLALIVSIAAIIVAEKDSRETTKVASEALIAARQANDISMGRLREQPKIEMFNFPKSATFLSADDLSTDQNYLSLMNTGKVPVSGIELLLVGVPGLIYLIQNPSEVYKDMPTLTSKIDFDQQLAPTALARISLRNSV